MDRALVPLGPQNNYWFLVWTICNGACNEATRPLQYCPSEKKRRRYWPRGMPAKDIFDSLGQDFGNYGSMKSTEEDVYVAATRDREPKCVIATCGITTPTDDSITRSLNSTYHTARRLSGFQRINKLLYSNAICLRFAYNGVNWHWCSWRNASRLASWRAPIDPYFYQTRNWSRGHPSPGSQ